MSTYSLSRACAINSNVLCAVGIQEIEGAQKIRAYQYHYGTWEFVSFSSVIQSIARYQRPDGCISVFMSPKGELFSPESSFRVGVIIEESLRPAKKLGRLADLRQIGKYLFACGDGGQTYRRHEDGRWSSLASDLFDDEVDHTWAFAIKAPGVTGAEQQEYWQKHPAELEERRRRIRTFNANLQLHAINGTSAGDIYFCGAKGSAYHWRYGVSTKLNLPTSASLSDISIEDESRVWLCGLDGTLLCGSIEGGFTLLPCTGAPAFSKIARFQEKVYLSSIAGPRGLFVYDGTLRQVMTGLRPELADVHTVDAVDDSLWVIGSKDIARFDGFSWERIPFPE